jgi:2-keto-3-deoxy-L-rhamnonate aldolase RhmA
MAIAGEYGVDCVLIDLEHSTAGLEVAEQLVIAAQLAGITAVVRPPSVGSDCIGQLLDAGADGIVFPGIGSAGDARLARGRLRYPPDGSRGWGGAHTRHAGWRGGFGIEALRSSDADARGVYTTEYVERAEADILSIFIIESRSGVEEIDAILDEGAPDAISFGWGDYSVEVGFDAKACEDAFEHVYSACREHACGMAIPMRMLSTHFYPGCYTVAGIDSLMLSGAVAQGIERAQAAWASVSL